MFFLILLTPHIKQFGGSLVICSGSAMLHAGFTVWYARQLFHVQYLQSVVFSFEKGLNSQNHFSDFHHLNKKSTPTRTKNLPVQNVPFPPPINTIWKTLGLGSATKLFDLAWLLVLMMPWCFCCAIHKTVCCMLEFLRCSSEVSF